MIKHQTITFDNPVQRPSDQWTIKSKSLLIDSLLSFCIPDIFAIESSTENEEGRKVSTYDIIDGKQRLTIISSFLADEWALTELEPVILESTKEEYEISGKKFSELPKDVQDEIKGYTLEFNLVDLKNYDNKESMINDIFYRLNNGKAVSKEHLSLVKAKPNVQNFVHKMISEHKLFTGVAHFTPVSIKKSDREMTILQSILLISGLDYKSFAAKDVEVLFAKNVITEETLSLTEQCFTDIVDTFTDHNKHASKINIPIMSYVLTNIENEHKDIAKTSMLKYFNEDMMKGDKYKTHCGAGCTKREKVRGRITALQNICEANITRIPTFKAV